MSLSAQSNTIRIVLRANNDSGSNFNRSEYYVTIQNNDISITPEFYGGSAYDETIGAKRLSNLRGFRVSVSLSYNMAREDLVIIRYTSGSGSTGSSTFREMFNEIVSAFRDGTFDGGRPFSQLSIYVLQEGGSWAPIVSPDGSFVGFVPTELSYNQSYTNQVGRFTPSISLTAQDLITQIGDGLEGRS